MGHISCRIPHTRDSRRFRPERSGALTPGRSGDESSLIFAVHGRRGGPLVVIGSPSGTCPGGSEQMFPSLHTTGPTGCLIGRARHSVGACGRALTVSGAEPMSGAVMAC